jgi:hypothetical protein
MILSWRAVTVLAAVPPKWRDVPLPAKIHVCENRDTRGATVTDEPNFGASMNSPEKK